MTQYDRQQWNSYLLDKIANPLWSGPMPSIGARDQRVLSLFTKEWLPAPSVIIRHLNGQRYFF